MGDHEGAKAGREEEGGQVKAAALALPDILREHQSELAEALSEPLFKNWDEEEKFHEAVQPAAIGRVLIRAIHEHLVNAKIGYLYREKIERRGQLVWAQVSKAGGKLAYFSDLDFLVEVNWTQWNALDPARRVALMDHELTHCERHETDAGEKYVIAPHDLEEFNSIARRWGSWRPQIAHFSNALGYGQQLGLFTHD